MSPLHEPLPADGFTARWAARGGSSSETLTLTWDNEGWTASGIVEGPDVQYVVRLSSMWQVSQFLLFRDLDEPDLWLGTDGRGRWGEVNGAHRVDLDGATDVALAITPFTYSIPIRRLALEVGTEAPAVVLDVDVETLGVVPAAVVIRRIAVDRYEFVRSEATVVVDVDDHGLALDAVDFERR